MAHRHHDDLMVVCCKEEENDDESRDEVDGGHQELWPMDGYDDAMVSTLSHHYSSKMRLVANVCKISFVVGLLLWFLGRFLSGDPRHAADEMETNALASTTLLSPSPTTPSPTIDIPAPHHPTIALAPAPARAYPTGCVFDFDRDRFDNENNFQNNVLFPGQYICSKNRTNNHEEDKRYRFGLVAPPRSDHEKKGSFQLVLIDTMAPSTHYNDYDIAFMVYQQQQTTSDNDVDVTVAAGSSDENHLLIRFSLQINGTFALISLNDDGKAAMISSPNKEMHLNKQCLEKHDCPYLHLQADGVLVVNYIDENHEWQTKNAKHVYDYIKLHS